MKWLCQLSYISCSEYNLASSPEGQLCVSLGQNAREAREKRPTNVILEPLQNGPDDSLFGIRFSTIQNDWGEEN